MKSTQSPTVPGSRYGRLTVIAPADPEEVRPGLFRPRWLCRCDCGVEAVRRQGSLRNGHTRSCGCLKIEVATAQIKAVATKHGKYRSPEWNSWRSMLARCHNPGDKAYHRYGGRGITVCERWLTSFDDFLADMGPRPSPEYSLDRIDNAAGYSPENCRWATKTEQARNTRATRFLTFNGETLCMQEWADRLGINPCSLADRLRLGWSVERALSTAGDARFKRDF